MIRARHTHAQSLRKLADGEAFGDRFDRLSDVCAVLLVEALYGKSTFYGAYNVFPRRLIEDHCFTMIAVEADCADTAGIICYPAENYPSGLQA